MKTVAKKKIFNYKKFTLLENLYVLYYCSTKFYLFFIFIAVLFINFIN